MNRTELEEAVAALAAWAIDETGKQGEVPPRARILSTMPKFQQLIYLITDGQADLSMEEMQEKEADVNAWQFDESVSEHYNERKNRIEKGYLVLLYLEDLRKPHIAKGLSKIRRKRRKPIEENVYPLLTEG